MKRSKIFSALLSLTIAFGLWLYVVTFVSSEHTDTIHNIPVVFEGETVLSDRNLMITSGKDAMVTLTLTGSRADLGKVNNQNIIVKVDLAKVYDAGEHKLTYTYTYSGDVANDAFSVVKNTSTIPITVEKIGRREVPVKVVCTGKAADNFLSDTENVVLDYSFISVTGPQSVVELIDHARIDVDLEGRNESISENYRYTLCDKDENPVDVSQVTTNVAEVHVDLKIQRYEEIPLRVTATYGGGATENSTTIEIKPATIRVSGSDALLAELPEINLGTIDLASLTENTTMTFPITLPDGVINLSGNTEATVDISFTGLSIKEFSVDHIQVVNVPEGMDYVLLSEVLKVTLRGPTALINSIAPEDITVTVDCTGKELGSTTVKANISLRDEKYAEVGPVGTHSVSVTFTQKEG